MWWNEERQGDGREIGTLAQLKNLLNLSSVPCSHKNYVHATEDFLHLVLEAHVLSAALEHFGTIV